MNLGEICGEHDLLCNRDGVIRVPFLVKGHLVVPPDISRTQIDDIFRNEDKAVVYRKLPGGQVVREPIIDRESMSYTGEYVYQVMPAVTAAELIENDFDKLVDGPFALKVDGIIGYLDSLIDVLIENPDFAINMRDLYRLTTEFPDTFLETWFLSMYSTFGPEAARQMINAELSLWGKPGSEFLNGWVDIPSQIITGATSMLEEAAAAEPAVTRIRAMPTRQLHITAGNAPEVPLASILRAILTKSAAVVKLPYGAILSGALFAVAAAAAEPEHPLTKNMSVVYWQGGDKDIEDGLFAPGAFDRIVVWGSPEAVVSVQSRALFTRTVFFNPRYGVSLIGREAFTDGPAAAAEKAAADALIYNQKACTASLVQYVEGTAGEIGDYAKELQQALAKWDREVPNFVPPATLGQIKSMKRGRYSRADWYLNETGGRFTSGVVVMPGEFDILDHPMSRLVVVRPVSDLTDALKYLNQNVSTVGIYPEERRVELRDRVAARGVSNVFPLGECERMYPGMPHDGMPVLSELVDWKNS